jgi:hypothetical protein
MYATLPTCHFERSPLKSPADSNTAPQQQQKSPTIKMGWKTKGESIVQK